MSIVIASGNRIRKLCCTIWEESALYRLSLYIVVWSCELLYDLEVTVILLTKS